MPTKTVPPKSCVILQSPRYFKKLPHLTRITTLVYKNYILLMQKLTAYTNKNYYFILNLQSYTQTTISLNKYHLLQQQNFFYFLKLSISRISTCNSSQTFNGIGMTFWIVSPTACSLFTLNKIILLKFKYFNFKSLFFQNSLCHLKLLRITAHKDNYHNNYQL